MKYAVVTFGCRVNQADSLDIERQMRALGGGVALEKPVEEQPPFDRTVTPA